MDFEPMLSGLRTTAGDLTLFTQVRVEVESHTLVWPNGADWDPAILS